MAASSSSHVSPYHWNKQIANTASLEWGVQDTETSTSLQRTNRTACAVPLRSQSRSRRKGASPPVLTCQNILPHTPLHFNIWVQADVTGEGVHFTIKTPDGKVVCEEDGDFDARTKVQLRVPKGFDAALQVCARLWA